MATAVEPSVASERAAIGDYASGTSGTQSGSRPPATANAITTRAKKTAFTTGSSSECWRNRYMPPIVAGGTELGEEVSVVTQTALRPAGHTTFGFSDILMILD